METKAFYQSKTILFNLLYFIIMLAGLFGFGGFTPDSQSLEAMTAGATLLNVVLRLVTSQPVR